MVDNLVSCQRAKSETKSVTIDTAFALILKIFERREREAAMTTKVKLPWYYCAPKDLSSSRKVL
jgi:hypothetical protein